MKRTNELIQKFAARHGRIVAEHGIDEPRAVFELAVVPNHKANADRLVKDAASESHNAVDKLHSLADLRRLFFA